MSCDAPYKNPLFSLLILFYFAPKTASKRCCLAPEKFEQVDKVWIFFLPVFQQKTIALSVCSTYFRMIWFFLPHKFTRNNLDMHLPLLDCPISVLQQNSFLMYQSSWKIQYSMKNSDYKNFVPHYIKNFCYRILRKRSQIVQWNSHK